MKKSTASYSAQGGIIAALYILLTLVSGLFGLSSGLIQVRLSEALCLLPCFLPAAVPGLFVGCMISNILTGGAIADVLFGSIATLLGALGSRALRKNRWLASLPPLISNSIIIPFILKYVYGLENGMEILIMSVFVGEFLSVCIFGQVLYSLFEKNDFFDI